MANNREGSKVRQAALAVVSAAVPTLTFPDHDEPTTIHFYNALRARTQRAAGVTSTADDRAKQLPCVSFQSLDGQSVILGLGNKRVPLVLVIESSADASEDLEDDDPEANHDELVAAVVDAVNTDTIAADLSAAIEEFYVFEVFDMGEHSVEAEDGVFVSAHRWDVVCAPVALS